MKKRNVQLFVAAGPIIAGFVLGGAGLVTAEVLENNFYDNVRMEINSSEFEEAYNEALENLQFDVAQGNISARDYLEERKRIESDEYMAEVYFAQDDVIKPVQEDLAAQQEDINNMRTASYMALVSGVSVGFGAAMFPEIVKTMREVTHIEREDRKRFKQYEQESRERLARYAREIAEREAEKEV